ncbi:hypothetical protein MTO96_046903 [Rhipicephalus appendiculatus]
MQNTSSSGETTLYCSKNWRDRRVTSGTRYRRGRNHGRVATRISSWSATTSSDIHSLPETSSDSRLRSRGNVSSTPKRAGNGSRCRVANAECHTDPVTRRRPRTSFYEDHGPNPLTPARHLPTPIRPRASPSEIATWFTGESKHISLISGHPWSTGPTSGEQVTAHVQSLAYSSGPICRICHEGM